MAIFKQGNRTELPVDAVEITKEEALKLQTKLFYGWEDSSDVWPFRYGAGLLGSLSAITGMYINHHFRTKLKLGTFGRMSSYLPIVVLPAIMTTAYHKMFIHTDILLEEVKCPLCTQSKAGLMQIGLGIAYPFGLAPLASYMFATRHYTFRLPSITKNPMDVLKLYTKIVKPILFISGVAVVVHWSVAMYITYKEMESYHIVFEKLRKFEEEECGKAVKNAN